MHECSVWGLNQSVGASGMQCRGYWRGQIRAEVLGNIIFNNRNKSKDMKYFIVTYSL